MFHTVICDLLGIRYPILQGAMQGGGGVALVAAVSEVGGLGVLPTFGGTDQKLRADIAAVRAPFSPLLRSALSASRWARVSWPPRNPISTNGAAQNYWRCARPTRS